MRGVLAEAHELVDENVISDEDFSAFVFRNPVRLLARSGCSPE